MKGLLVATAAAVALALPASEPAAGWKNLDGKKAPPVAADTWLAAPGDDTPDRLAGKVYLLEFFATW